MHRAQFFNTLYEQVQGEQSYLQGGLHACQQILQPGLNLLTDWHCCRQLHLLRLDRHRSSDSVFLVCQRHRVHPSKQLLQVCLYDCRVPGLSQNLHKPQMHRLHHGHIQARGKLSCRCSGGSSLICLFGLHARECSSERWCNSILSACLRTHLHATENGKSGLSHHCIGKNNHLYNVQIRWQNMLVSCIPPASHHLQ